MAVIASPHGGRNNPFNMCRLLRRLNDLLAMTKDKPSPDLVTVRSIDGVIFPTLALPRSGFKGFSQPVPAIGVEQAPLYFEDNLYKNVSLSMIN